jgi:hypothetical protein
MIQGAYKGKTKGKQGTVRMRGKKWSSEGKSMVMERYSYARTNESDAARHNAECAISNFALASGAGLSRVPGAGNNDEGCTVMTGTL